MDTGYKKLGVIKVLYAYVLENKSRIYEVDNKPLFKLIRDCNLHEDDIFIDDIGSLDRIELKLVKNKAVSGDTVMVRSLLDIADTPSFLIDILKYFGDIGVDVVSVKEAYYDYKQNFNIIEDSLRISLELSEKKRKMGIEKARIDGKMGRKANLEIKNKVLKLKNARFSISEIIDMCDISRSTYYRILNSVKNDI